MSEYVYATDEHKGHWLTGEEIVRCMDCIYFDNDTNHGAHCWKFGNALWDDYDGFCAWGEKASNFTTCKCGEEIELGNRESALCPSCGRTVIE